MSINYLAHTAEERSAMLGAIGMQSMADIFKVIPASLQDFILQLPEGLSELELTQELQVLSSRNRPLTEQSSFLGAGAYHHFVPAALDLLITRSEFLTAYTPYQAEISQGTLQAIYEFQSSLCTLTGMEIANASNYEGATSVVEAMLMALRITGRKQVLVSSLLHPEYREVMETYAKALDLQLTFVDAVDGLTDVSSLGQATHEPATLIVQYPNALGGIEDLQAHADWIHAQGGLLITAMTDPVVLGVLEAPGHLGADIVAGEAQACGNALSFGGPYVGFLSTREKYIRQMPGRLSGLTRDEAGDRAFSLVLQTREQHIRRERATSNICTNQGLNALIATIWFSLVGQQGLQEMAQICLQRAHYLAAQITDVAGFELAYPETPFFHEFVVKTTHSVPALMAWLEAQGYLAGLPVSKWYPGLDHHILVAVTEMNTVPELDRFIALLRQFPG